MKISARGEYGSRAMVELAVHWQDGPISLAVIAERQNVPRKFLEQLITPLKAANLVNGYRGVNGGYELARNPADISLLEIVEALEGPMTVMDCHTTEPDEPCCMWDSCGLRDTWQNVQDAARDVLRKTTLKSLADCQVERQHAHPRTGRAPIQIRISPSPPLGANAALGQRTT